MKIHLAGNIQDSCYVSHDFTRNVSCRSLQRTCQHSIFGYLLIDWLIESHATSVLLAWIYFCKINASLHSWGTGFVNACVPYSIKCTPMPLHNQALGSQKWVKLMILVSEVLGSVMNCPYICNYSALWRCTGIWSQILSLLICTNFMSWSRLVGYCLNEYGTWYMHQLHTGHSQNYKWYAVLVACIKPRADDEWIIGIFLAGFK